MVAAATVGKIGLAESGHTVEQSVVSKLSFATALPCLKKARVTVAQWHSRHEILSWVCEQLTAASFGHSSHAMEPDWRVREEEHEVG